MSPANGQSDCVIITERVLPFRVRRVHNAFKQPESLARWWGPTGFRNTFSEFEFTPGGRWVFVMHGPNGIDYPNESVFREIEPEAKIVIEHISEPLFTLTIILTARGSDTHLNWIQEFKSATVAERLRAIVQPANEQNLDRLQALLASENV